MKKILAILLLAACFSEAAFAASGGNATATVNSRQRYEDSNGTTYERILGTLSMDANYNCSATNNVCGYKLVPSRFGVSSISKIDFEPQFSNVVGATGSVVFFKYHREGKVDNGVTGLETANIRAYYTKPVISDGKIVNVGLISTPSYDFSGLTSVPFELVGPVL